MPERRTGHRAPVGALVEGGATLDAVGPGSVLGGRYTLVNRLDDGPDRSTWQAQDGTLDRRVRLLIVAGDHPAAEDVLDAARRAAAVDDPRLVRVLDVGHDDGGTYVVTEWLDGHDLATLVATGPLVAEQVRHLVGEASLGLEAARRRGLHHLRLRPALVHRLADGSVKVEGLVTEAALDRVEVGDGDEASRRDATGLVALAYAALTGLWPMDEPDADLAPAPRLQGAVAPPSQVVAGVPADLDALCARTLVGQAGPATPGGLAAQIAPWGGERRPPRATGAFPHPLPPVRLAPGTPGSPGTPLRGHPGDQAGPGQADRATGRGRSRSGKRAAQAERAAITAPHPVPQAVPQPTPDRGQQATREMAAAPRPEPASGPPTQIVDPVATQVVDPAATQVVAPVTEPAPASAREQTATRSETPAAASARQQTAARSQDPAPAEPAASARPGVAGRQEATRRPEASPRAPARARSVTADLLGITRGDLDAPPPRRGASRPAGASPANRPSGPRSRRTLAIVAALVAVFLLLAWKGLSGLGDDPFAGSRAAAPTSGTTPSPTATASATPTASSSPTSSAPTSSAPVDVRSAAGFDPEGDGQEKDATADQAVDGDPDTSWTSDRYRSAEFSGLKKGLGLRLKFDGRHEVHQVKVTLGGSGATVQLRQVDGDSPSSDVLDEKKDASGTVTLKPSSPFTADELVVWFTRAAPTDGGYRVEVAEVAVS